MDKLESLNLRIDDGQNLRIVPEDVVSGSRSISNKIDLVLSSLGDIKGRLERTLNLITELEEQTEKSRMVSMAERIVDLQDLKV